MTTKKAQKVIVIAAVVLCVAALSIPLSSLVYPDISRLKRENPRSTAFMEYRAHQWMKEGKRKSISFMWVPLSTISPYAAKAVLIAEDDKFWSHEGFDFKAMGEAFEKNLKARRVRAGGSTISQQLVKNLYLSPSKSPVRKIREAILTWRLEHTLSKRRILELYLNVAEWGDGVYGIEAASRHYFGVHASELEPMQAARLASVLPNPRKYDPRSASRYVIYRSGRIYGIMVRRGIVIPESEETAPDGES